MPDQDPTATSARRPRASAAFPVGVALITALLIVGTATVVARTSTPRIAVDRAVVVPRGSSAAVLGSPRLLAERRTVPTARTDAERPTGRTTDDSPTPTTTTPDTPPPTTAPSASATPPSTTPTTTAPPPITPSPPPPPPAPSPVAPDDPDTGDPGTGDLAARARAAFVSAVPESWRHAVPAEIRIIPGHSSWASTQGRIHLGSRHASGDWVRLRAIVAHEFGHLIAFRYGTSSRLGAPPAGWPEPGPAAPERWADCVATAFTGHPLGSHGHPACGGEALRWAVDYLDAGPPR